MRGGGAAPDATFGSAGFVTRVPGAAGLAATGFVGNALGDPGGSTVGADVAGLARGRIAAMAAAAGAVAAGAGVAAAG